MTDETQKVEQEATAGLKTAAGDVGAEVKKGIDWAGIWAKAHPQLVAMLMVGMAIGFFFGYLWPHK